MSTQTRSQLSVCRNAPECEYRGLSLAKLTITFTSMPHSILTCSRRTCAAIRTNDEATTILFINRDQQPNVAQRIAWFPRIYG